MNERKKNILTDVKDPHDTQTMELPFVRNPYNYDRRKASLDTALQCKDPTRAQQNPKDECDINTIVERFKLTGQLPTNVRMPTSGDFTDVPDFQQAMDAIVNARLAFQAMPAKVRSRFHNDPAEFVAFCDEPDNLEEARKLGLVPAKEHVPTPDPKTPPATPPAAAEPPKGGKETPKGGVT